MNDSPNGNGSQPEGTPAAPRSVITIEFQSPGSSELSMRSESVTPAQMLAASAWLDWFARRTFDRLATEHEKKAAQIAIVHGGVPIPRV